MSKRQSEVEKVEQLALRLTQGELRELAKRIARPAGIRVVMVKPGELTPFQRRRIVARERVSSSGEGPNQRQSDAYPTLDELRALPLAERNRRVVLALTRAQDQDVETFDAFGIGDEDMDEAE